MESHTLLTYRNLTELRKIQDDREVFTFKEPLIKSVKGRQKEQSEKIRTTAG